MALQVSVGAEVAIVSSLPLPLTHSLSCAGTGKTLVARALANTCTVGGKRVNFFMRKVQPCAPLA